MTNNNTPRLLPQIQPGSSSTTLSSTPPFRFSHIRHHGRKIQSQYRKPPAPPQVESQPETRSPNQLEDSGDIRPSSRDPSHLVALVLESPSSLLSNSKPTETGKKRKSRHGQEGEGEQQKERSKRRRGECHYKRKVEKPRGPPSWLLRSKPASVHPPLPSLPNAANASSTSRSRIPIIPNPSPMIIPTNPRMLSPSVTTPNPLFLPPSHPLGPSSFPDQQDLTPLLSIQPSIPSSSSSSSYSNSLATIPSVSDDRIMRMGDAGNFEGRRSTEPSRETLVSNGYPMYTRMEDTKYEIFQSAQATPSGDPLSTLPSSSQTSFTSSTPSSFASTSTAAYKATYNAPSHLVDISSYHPAIPFLEVRSPYTSNPLMTSGESSDPNTMSMTQRYPGGRFLKYS
ncbi:uncharacterized protein L199_003624 [Kwoniella botswanensis]|uniref:uncharacterized protein n=1 Tax=Kwoniella botswanensis TaxID=1268659 RepID=UPI00315D8C47